MVQRGTSGNIHKYSIYKSLRFGETLEYLSLVDISINTGKAGTVVGSISEDSAVVPGVSCVDIKAVIR